MRSGAYDSSDLISQSATPTQSEYVAEEFETSVTEETTTQLAQEIEEIVRAFQRAIDDDDLIESICVIGEYRYNSE